MEEKVKGLGERCLRALGAIALVAVLSLCGAAYGCSGSDGGSGGTALMDTGGSSQGSVAETGTLSFTMAASEWSTDGDGRLVVKVEGDSAAGKKVLERYKAVPDQKYDVQLPAGEYEFSLDTGQLTTGLTVYACTPQKILFDGKTDENVVLVVQVDAAATAAAEQAEADRIAAETAQREAEERAAAEQAAAAEAARVAQEQQAAAEAEAARVAQEQAAAAQQAAASQQREETVYTAASGKGSKYHTNPNCSGMKETISMTVSQATAQGYTPCKKCA